MLQGEIKMWIGKWRKETALPRSSQLVLVVNNPPANAGDIRDIGSIPGWGRSPGGGHDNTLQCSCLENPMDRGAWWAAVHRVAKSWTQPKQLNVHECSVGRPHPILETWQEQKEREFTLCLKVLSWDNCLLLPLDLGWNSHHKLPWFSGLHSDRTHHGLSWDISLPATALGVSRSL